MDAVIIAAVKGTRMRPLTERRPKPLLPLGETTLIERTLDQCVDVVDQFVVVVGYRADNIKDAIGDAHEGTPIEYVTQAEALGTAHAIGQASEIVEDRFFVLNGDIVVDETLLQELAAAGLAYHRRVRVRAGGIQPHQGDQTEPPWRVRNHRNHRIAARHAEATTPQHPTAIAGDKPLSHRPSIDPIC